MMRSDLEYKLAANGTAFVRGYGAVFGNVDSYGDVIQKGAFSKAVRMARSGERWPAMLLQHGGLISSAEDMTPIGLWTSMVEDDYGLLMEGTIANTARGRDLVALLDMKPRPALDGLSIGYRVSANDIDLGSRSGEPRRTLKSIDLHEVSFVTFPANTRARLFPASAAPKSDESLEGLISSMKRLTALISNPGPKTRAISYVKADEAGGVGGLAGCVASARRLHDAIAGATRKVEEQSTRQLFAGGRREVAATPWAPSRSGSVPGSYEIARGAQLEHAADLSGRGEVLSMTNHIHEIIRLR